MKRSVFFILSLIFLFQSAGSNEIPESCYQSKLVSESSSSNSDEDLFITSDKSILQDNTYILDGNTTIEKNNLYLSADHVEIDRNREAIKTLGNVKFNSSKFSAKGNQFSILKSDDGNFYTGLDLKLLSKNNHSFITAEQMKGTDSKQIFVNSKYTLCPFNNINWSLNSSKLTLDYENNTGSAEDLYFSFFDYPIFYLPSYDWALKGRNSGFLAPNFSIYKDNSDSGKTGFQIVTPYYFNLAKDKDFLLTLNSLSNRGQVLEGKYRQLIYDKKNSVNGLFKIGGAFIENDNVLGKKRWSIDADVNFQIDPKTKLKLVNKRVSDKKFFRDILKTSDDDTLLSFISLAHSDLDNNFESSLLIENEQPINSGSYSYTKKPKIFISKKFHSFAKPEFSFSFESFDTPDKTKITGSRSFASAEISENYELNNIYIAPRILLTNTYYNLSNSKEIWRFIPEFSIESGLNSEYRVNTNEYTQYIQPKILYTFAPKKNQSKIPLFDTDLNSNLDEYILQNKKFSGIDRISNANSLSFFLESQFEDLNHNNEFFTFSLGQKYHFEDYELDLDGNLEKIKSTSNLFFEFDYNKDDYLNISNKVNFNSSKNEVSESIISVNLGYSPKKNLKSQYINSKGEENIIFEGNYPINKNTTINFSQNQNISSSILNNRSFSMNYESCCWGIKIGNTKKLLDSNKFDNIFSIEATFDGLTSN